MNTRTAFLPTGQYCLAFPKAEQIEMVINSDRHTKKECETMLSDRTANNEAFPDEFVAELWVSLQWFGQHTTGREAFNAYLSAIRPSVEKSDRALIEEQNATQAA